MFLIIGYLSDPTIHHFADYLQKHGPPNGWRFLNLDAALTSKDCKITFKNDLNFESDGDVIDFSLFHSIYSRCYIKDNNENPQNWIIHLLISYLEETKKRVINKPSAGFDNYSKLLHAIRLSSFGFDIPYTFISGSSACAKAKVQPNGEWVSKGISSVRTEAKVVDELLYTNLDLLDRGPSLFQQRIQGYDVRLHVIENRSIALMISSEHLDYRYNKENNEYRKTEVPNSLLQKCISWCRQEKLVFAGIDFKVTADGKWYLLEVNPMPGYNFFDKKLDNKISEMLLDTLSKGRYIPKYSYELDRPFITASRRTY